MFRILPPVCIGFITLLLYAMLTIFWAFILFSSVIVMYLLPKARWRRKIQEMIQAIPEHWAEAQIKIMNLNNKTEWLISGIDKIKSNGSYIMLANHQSWTDILVLEKAFYKKASALRFFMKRELLWQLPIASQACVLLGFPVMKRYKKEFLQKHPEYKGKDIAATRKACEKFKSVPTTLINFLEGGRFTQLKHQHQKSPYKNLLKPKAGGVAFAIAAMGDCLQGLINVTIVYPEGDFNFWQFLCGQVPKVVVKVDFLPLTPNLIGDYENDRNFRVNFQSWINQLWQEKDQLINKTLSESVTSQRPLNFSQNN